MPKATTSAPSPNNGLQSGRPALRRNQACLQCRKRKLKCDASRPHCTTCVKQWQALISVPAPVGYAHPTEPPCSYDPVEGLPLAPDVDPLDRIRALEQQILNLKKRLGDSPRLPSPSDSFGENPFTGGRPRGDSYSGTSPVTPTAANTISGISMPRVSLDGFQYENGGSHSRNGLQQPRMDKLSPEPLKGLLFSGWNMDLPDPHMMFHLVDVFFRCDPCGSRGLHRPSFMASLRLPPRDPGFPHVSILHAICACASRWASRDIVTMPDGTRRDPFAEYHASKTRQFIDRTMATGADIFPVVQACILLSWYFYTDGRWVEVWIFAGFQSRVAIPLRLNYPGTYTTQGRNAPGAYLAPPKGIRELETRRRTWWMTVMFDRIVSASGWIHGVDERDIGTEFPLRTDDFYAERQVPSNPQDVVTRDLFTTHPPRYTDSFLLFLKATMLFGKVTDYTVRSNLRASEPPSASQDPYHLPGFEALDRLVSVDFLESLPAYYKHNYGLGSGTEGGTLDTDLYMVHVVPHAAAITLHTPFINFSEPNTASNVRCQEAAQSILRAYYVLSATSLDITRLHPFVIICWYLAAVVQVHLCKYWIEVGDTDKEATAWGEINLLRFAMLEYGSKSPIGTRQEKLLQGIMAEIVRMTSQKQPLQVGVPLYPFSHATLFANRTPAAGDGSSANGHIAPLPVGGDFDDDMTMPPMSPPAPPPPPQPRFMPMEGTESRSGYV